MVPDVLVVVAKSPVPGRVKTRLRPTFSSAEAAALAAAALRDTLDAAAAVGPRRIVVAWDGPRVSWLPSSVCVVPQRGSTLDERLEGVFEDVYAAEGGRDASVLLVGMDTPQLRAVDLDVPWDGHDAVLGPSCDGGYWCIGFRRHVPEAIRGLPMSTARTGSDQLTRLQRLGLRVRLLPTMQDVDLPSDAAAVAAAAPSSRFGRLHRRLVDSPCSPTTLFDAALSGEPVEIRIADGKERVPGFLGAAPLDATVWGRLTEADQVVVSRCEGPVLDVGCGPGRFVEALAGQGIPALGVDLSREAVDRTRQRGGSALVRDIYDELPGEGRWGTVLLADGNIGIGGDPVALLRRCRAVLRPGAVALVEASPDPGRDLRTSVTLHGPWGRRSHPVPWAVLGTSAVVESAAVAGFVAVEDWRVGGRAFVMLRHAG
jgi:glycosyltransferase A (GT-A) superfamily protein (DUF2064 family)/SAM-dependent methyltransferase